MNKTWLIIKREYLSRVTKRTFILTTVLTPIGFIIFWVALIFIMSSGVEKKKIALLDPGNTLQISEKGKLRDGMVIYNYPRKDLEELKSNFEDYGYKGILYIPDQNLDSATLTFNIHYYSNDDISITTQESIKKAISSHARKIKMDQLGINETILDKLNTSVELQPKNLDKSKEEVSSSRAYVATALGAIMMFLIYIVIFIYGNMVMRSVMEEKTNRIVEVLISSVRPFQLMLGKIVGVGAVGLTQFAIWGIVFPLLYLGVGFLFSGKLQQLQELTTTSTASNAGDIEDILVIIQELGNFNYGYILAIFLIFFLGGYVLYASLFAAVGAAMGDDWGEGQSLTLVIAIPVIIAFYIGIAVVENPNSSLAVWSSMFPLFSPIVMPARIVFDPPVIQLLMSVVILLITCFFFIWISGRIYRIGILMYGKKTTLKDFALWMFRKD
ncbi:MAG: ABC transporter permease [Saprospiraceae bacterium]|nr:ABC transporter permease [Saprospiraceae bacterium]